MQAAVRSSRAHVHKRSVAGDQIQQLAQRFDQIVQLVVFDEEAARTQLDLDLGVGPDCNASAFQFLRHAYNARRTRRIASIIVGGLASLAGTFPSHLSYVPPGN